MISTTNIDELIPDFLIESNYFQTILLDVEGNVMSCSTRLDSKFYSAEVVNFSRFLEPTYINSFEETIELLLASPKEKRQIVLAFLNIETRKTDQVWWEFSTVTNSDMDLIGIIGIGVSTKFLEQEMPWNSLVDLLEFGKIQLDTEFKVLDLDDKVIHWLGIGASGHDGNGEIFLSELPLKLDHLSLGSQPTCMVLSDRESGVYYSALLTQVEDGYQLYILPKSRRAKPTHLDKPYTPSHLASFPGAVWVVDKSLKFIQQNQLASDTAMEWSGISCSNSFDFIFNSELKSLKQLKLNFSKGFEGNPSDFELKINPSGTQSTFWYVGIRPIFDEKGLVSLLAVHGIMLPQISKRLTNLEAENKALRELVMNPSYILRSPLSSMLGLLDLIDPKQLDQENQKYFSYLKPLAKELDEVIRNNAKRLGAFD
ncbi:MAG: hypothetical protein P8O16_00805 [Algoriphagus sp.]|uniref:hypothetical protein n=1 Tax=Algoriphagus sp. TaxID=1872435 RepID=UPI002630DC2E|nr:hypothetical protein [Algoriphagus sp.]MDG1275785.1 hypothetical protein [Algoriphagus sp.]